MSAQQAYIAHLTEQTKTQVRTIIETCVGTGYAFEGDIARLSAPQQFSNAEAVHLDGDFGHAYSAWAEVRWRRNPGAEQGDETTYDVLVLTEDQKYQPGNATPILGSWRVREVKQQRYVMQTGGYNNVRLIEYWDEQGGGATLFARYAEVKP
jgi:hypothetical protein